MGKENTELKRGGKRPFSGRKKSNYQTKTIAFRVRVEWVDEIKEIVNTKIQELKNNASD